MLINRTHRSWAIACGLLTAIAAAAYLVVSRTVPEGPSGGTWQGLLFGVAGAACMLYAGLLSGRKKLPGRRIGTARAWLRGHLWIGLLSVPLILFHTGFRFGGLLEQLLMVVFFIVIGSGVVGVLLQQYLPRILTFAAPGQAIYEQLPMALQRLSEHVAQTVAAACDGAAQPWAYAASAVAGAEAAASPTTGPPESIPPWMAPSGGVGYSPEAELAGFFRSEVQPYLQSATVAGHPLANPTYALARISQLQGSLPARLQPAVAEIKSACEERRQLAVQERIHRWLHGWLFIHLPLSLALLVLTLLHVAMSMYY